MKLDTFNKYCASLPATNTVVQWGGAHVWKVGDKIFAMASKWGKTEGEFLVGFKSSDMAFRMLTEESGISPSPYLGRYKWVQIRDPEVLNDEDTKAYIQAAYDIVKAKLTKAKRKELGI